MRAWTIPGRAEYSVPQSVSARWHARHMKGARRHPQRAQGGNRRMVTVPKPATSPWGRAIDGLCANAANRACFWAAPLVGRKSAHHRNDPTWGRYNSGTCRPVLHAPRIMQIGSTGQRRVFSGIKRSPLRCSGRQLPCGPRAVIVSSDPWRTVSAPRYPGRRFRSVTLTRNFGRASAHSRAPTPLLEAPHGSD